MRHEIPLAIIDAVLFVEVDGRRAVMTSWLESDRIARVTPDLEILDIDALGIDELLGRGMSLHQATRELALRAVRQIGLDAAIVPGDFPLGLADHLRAAGVQLIVDDQAIERRRRRKAPAELDGVRAAQRAAEAAMASAAGMLARAVASDGRLELDGSHSRRRTCVTRCAQPRWLAVRRCLPTCSSARHGAGTGTTRAAARCPPACRSRSTSGRATRRAPAGPT